VEISLISKIVLYIIIIIFAFLAAIVCGWQIMVLRGKSMKNPDGSVDDWHEQKLFYGIALADITVAIPVTFVGIVLIFVGWRIGYYLTGLA
jgi:TRAP-type C4-dicarboxylate transport system permease small subunit